MLGGALLGEVRAPGGDLHAEGGADPGDLGADPAEADHAEVASVQVGADGGLPGPPVRRAVFSATRLRARPRMRAQVSSTGGVEWLSVPQTVTPWARAAARSIAELRMPEATSRRRRGRRAKREAGKGTRSRRVTTMSKSASAAASSSSVPKWSGKEVSSTRSRTGDQSAAVVATPWWSFSRAQRSGMRGSVRVCGTGLSR